MIRLRALVPCVFAFTVLSLTGCGSKPAQEQIIKRFEKEHPEAKVVKVTEGEGDGNRVRMYVDYLLPGSPKPRRIELQVHWRTFPASWGYEKGDLPAE